MTTDTPASKPARPFAAGGWITLADPAAAETMARAGYDYLGIDGQHGVAGPAEIRLLLQVLTPGTLPVLVRVPANDMAAIGSVLDAGATGVVVPLVNTAAEARAAVTACSFPPKGNRSFGPLRPHLPRDPGALSAGATCFAMVETRLALQNLTSIAATPGLSGLYFGPADMAISLGLAPQTAPADPNLRAAQQAIAAACRGAGIRAAAHAMSVQAARALIEDGYDMVTLLSDRYCIAAGAAQALADLV